MPNNKQTTAVSQLIEKLKELRDFYPPNGNAMIRRVRGTYTNAIIEAQKQLPIERKQIEDAYIQARKHSISSSEIALTTASDYFTSTFITD